ncbi:MAG: hypothetical protein PHD43_21375 [Methylococcales bacterium]|nr:hypothetical protein [Methylococcales bacterium]
MMKAYTLNRSKSKSLTAQIRDTERQLLKRQEVVGDRAATLSRKIHQQLTAPSTLMMTVGIGFIIGELTKHQTTNNRGIANKQRTAESTPLRTALNLLTSVHTLYTALPIAWIMKSFYQPGPSDRQATEQQARPVAAGNCGRSSR